MTAGLLVYENGRFYLPDSSKQPFSGILRISYHISGPCCIVLLLLRWLHVLISQKRTPDYFLPVVSNNGRGCEIPLSYSMTLYPPSAAISSFIKVCQIVVSYIFLVEWRSSCSAPLYANW